MLAHNAPSAERIINEAHVTIRDLTAETIQRIMDAVHRQKRSRPS